MKRRWFMVFLFLGISAGSVWADPGDPSTYELSYLFIHGRRQDTMVYDLNGDGRLDILNTSVNFDDQPRTRWLAYHLRDEKGNLPVRPTHLFPIDDRACVLVLGDYLPGGGVEVGFVAPDGIYVYSFTEKGIDEKPIKLIHERTFFNDPSKEDLLIWTYAEDLDSDGKHDLIVPLSDGYKIYFQTAPGQFSHVVHLESGLANQADQSLQSERWSEKSEKVISTFLLHRSLPKLTVVDINGDGRKDLITIEKDLITYFFQRPIRQYQSNRRNRFRYPIPTLAGEVEKNKIDLPIITFVDINNDRKADMVVTRVVGKLGMLESLETRVYVHIGNGRGNFLSDQAIQVRGVTIDPTFADMNMDGKLDCMVSRLRTDLMRQGGQLLVLGEIRITYEIFQYDGKKGTYEKDPVFEKVVRVNKDDLKEKKAASVPMVFVSGDLSGDGRPDMVVVESRTNEIKFQYGEVHWSGGEPVIGFESSPFFRKKLDKFPKRVTVYDANGDGLDDVFLHHSGSVGILESRREK